MAQNEIKTEKELTIELRNQIAFRIVEYKASIAYWKIIIRQSKSNSPQIVEALQKKADQEDKLRKDTNYLKVIDEMIRGGK